MGEKGQRVMCPSRPRVSSLLVGRALASLRFRSALVGVQPQLPFDTRQQLRAAAAAAAEVAESEAHNTPRTKLTLGSGDGWATLCKDVAVK